MDEALKQDKHEISVITLLATEAFKIMKPKSQSLLAAIIRFGNSAVDRRTVIQRIKMIDYFEKDKPHNKLCLIIQKISLLEPVLPAYFVPHS